MRKLSLLVAAAAIASQAAANPKVCISTAHGSRGQIDGTCKKTHGHGSYTCRFSATDVVSPCWKERGCFICPGSD
jgi:hypothetical protein